MTLPSWLRGSVLLVATLGAGIAIGITYDQHRMRPGDGAHAGAAHVENEHVMRHLAQELTLDSGQQQAVAAILARHQRAVDSSWSEVRPRVHATLDSALREVVTVLRPEQAARLRRMVDMHADSSKR